MLFNLKESVVNVDETFFVSIITDKTFSVSYTTQI